MAQMTDQVRHHVEQLPRWHKENRERVAALNREVTELATGALIEQLRQSYAEFPPVVDYLAAVREDILRNARSFLPEDGGPVPAFARTEHRPLLRYSVNLLVERAGSQSAPIIYESRPSVQNLLGRVEHTAEFGALFTNFTMIRAGALHRANGGYLILDADRLLTAPCAACPRWRGRQAPAR